MRPDYNTPIGGAFSKRDLYKAVTLQPVQSEKAAKEFAKAIIAGDKDGQKPFFEIVGKSFNMITDVLRGDALPEEVMAKTKSFDAMPHDNVGPVGWTFDRLLSQLTIDTKWVNFYNMVNARGYDHIVIDEVTRTVTFNDVDELEKAKPQNVFKSKKRMLWPQRRTAKIPISTFQLETNPRVTINNLIQDINIGKLRKMANDAYTNINSGTPGTTTFVTSIIKTINDCFVDLIQAADSNDPPYDVDETTPVILLYRFDYHTDVLNAFDTIGGTDGNNERLRFPVIPVSTSNSNLDLQPDGTNNGGIMFIPGRELIHGEFTPLKVEATRDPDTDSETLVANYRDNFYNADIQKRNCNFA